MQVIKRLLYSTLIALTVASCTGSKQINMLSKQATEAYNVPDYALAYSLYDSIISLNSNSKKNLEGLVYRQAGIAAWEVGKTENSIELLEKAKQMKAANGKSLFVLAKAYKTKDNLSLEIINLTEYFAGYADGNEANEARAQLFLAYVRSENWDLAYTIWSSLKGAPTDDVEMVTGYLLTLKSLNKSDEIAPIAKRLLQLNPKSLIAKEAIAIHLFKSAEERYQREINAYQKTKTSAQYKRLLKQLETINADFASARDYFEELYKLNPEPRYATYLGNIYTRFENKSKANYYYKKAKQ